VDRIMRDAAGFRMGPFELMDLTGIDVNYAASSCIYEGYQHDPRLRTTTLHRLMSDAGLFGRKTGRGFFDYAEGARPPPGPTAPDVRVTVRPHIVEPGSEWGPILAIPGFEAGDEVALIAPIGEDCATACARLGLDPRTTVAVDLTMAGKRHITVMAAIGGGAAAAKVADWLRGHGFTVEQIQDSPGFVLQRILAMIANLGCELAQIGVATPADIDLAMKLAQNYPRGPLEWADWLGVAKVHEIMRQLQAITGSDRYRPSLWLRRRAQLGLSAREVG
jgi:3-hydroxybutyryl-CoA dehydrogenase